MLLTTAKTLRAFIPILLDNRMIGETSSPRESSSEDRVGDRALRVGIGYAEACTECGGVVTWVTNVCNGKVRVD